ncbi:DUF2171 domain-containing protein [Roseomonas sp. CCTCC AB2023176]|uniref:DUF2171 domain-containing protein n=1 Tax=Roseomonas sp. CCTCC AB2023176 TaxID=3342640 RepID=UPI0035DB0064
MVDTTLIRERMPVVDCEGRRVGTVDHLDAGRIKLTRAGSSDGHHHYLPLSEVSSVDEAKVTSQLTFEELEDLFRSEGERSHAEG